MVADVESAGSSDVGVVDLPPSDFLLFSPRTYYRLFELYNAAIWPLQIVALAAGVAILLLCASQAWRGRLIAAMLAACWLWFAWAFHFAALRDDQLGRELFRGGFAIERRCCSGSG